MRSKWTDRDFTKSLSTRCVCPICHGKLETSTDTIRCAGCGRDFPVIDGIPDFVTEGASLDKIRELSQTYDVACAKYPGSPRSCGYSGETAYLSRLNILRRWIDLDQLGGKLILDVGCGIGLLTHELASKNEVWGVDISLGLLRAAREKGLGTVLASADLLPFRERDFAVVLCVGVIPYYENPRNIFRELCRVTEPGGQIVVTSTANSLLIRWAWFLKRRLGLTSELSHLYTAEEIEGYLVSSGGDIVDSCVGYRERVMSIRDDHPAYPFRLLARTTAVLATISDP